MHVRFALFALAVCFVGGSCLAQQAPEAVGYEGSPRFRILDSGYAGTRDVFPQMVWLDDERLLFKSPGLWKDQIWGTDAPPSWEPPPWALYIWNLRTGQVSHYVTLGKSIRDGGITCNRGPFVRYGFSREDDSIVLRWGRIGAEQERILSAEEYKSYKPGSLISIACEYFPSADQGVPGAPDKSYRPLWPEHGLLGIAGVGSGAFTYVFLPSGAKEPIPLNINRIVSISGYSEYAGAYVLADTPAPYIASSDNARPVYLFRPPNHIERIVVPAGPWSAYLTHDHRPTRKGWFFRSTRTAAPRAFGPGAAGGYLLSEGKPERIVEGFIFNLVVSPDGCKVALDDIPNVKPREFSAVRVLDLCSEGERR